MSETQFFSPHRSGLMKPLRALGLGLAVGWVVLALAAPAMADRVVTKSGQAFTGTIIEEDDAKVVLKTISGKITIERDTIEKIEKTGTTTVTPKADPALDPATTKTPKVVPEQIAPEDAPKAFERAKAAIGKGDWVKAAGVLEGLMAIDEAKFKYDDRLSATGALITCYLQIKDALGASQTFARLAQLAKDANDKRRLLAAAEVLRTLGTVKVGDKTLSRFEEVVEAAMPWKAEQCLEAAKDAAKKSKRLNDRTQLDKQANMALGKLREANAYVPGFSTKHEADVLAEMVNNIIEGAKATVEYCEKGRTDLTSAYQRGLVGRSMIAQFNQRVREYHATREAALKALKHVKAFTASFSVSELYSTNETEIEGVMEELDEYQYYPKGTRSPSSGYYGTYYSSARVRIKEIGVY